MGIPSGLDGQFGFREETTYGEIVTVNRFLQLADESVKTEIERLESKSIIAGARVARSSQWAAGLRRSEGDIGLEVYDGSIGLLLKHMMGTVSSTSSGGSAPYSHTFDVGSLTGKSLTVQFGRPTRTGAKIPFTYGGVKIQSWQIGLSVGEIATLGLTVVAQSETYNSTSTTGPASLQVASYDPNIEPLNFVNGSLTLGGSDLCVRSATISGENNLDTDRTCVGSRNILEPVEADLREYTAETEVEFGANGGPSELELYNRYINGEEAQLVLVLENEAGTRRLTISGNVRTDGETPTIGGREMLTYNLNMVFRGTTSDATAITMSYVTSDSTP